jgi:hypothetical protein
MPTAFQGGGGPVGRLVRRLGRSQRQHLVDYLLRQRREARGPRLVAQEAVDALLAEALLPAPDAGLRLAGTAHDLDGAQASGRTKHDRGAPDLLLRGVAVADDLLQVKAIGGSEFERYPSAHAADSHAPRSPGIPRRIQMSDAIH